MSKADDVLRRMLSSPPDPHATLTEQFKAKAKALATDAKRELAAKKRAKKRGK
jgi:hypothetical protein